LREHPCKKQTEPRKSRGAAPLRSRATHSWRSTLDESSHR
jgi:hypothetical protein